MSHPMEGEPDSKLVWELHMLTDDELVTRMDEFAEMNVPISNQSAEVVFEEIEQHRAQFVSD